jgi:hypothetical protein
MLFGSVEIPEALLEALQNNKLVIFAGAGVSMGKPANYPSFSKLAKDINRGTLDLDRFIKIEIDEKDEKKKEVWIEPIDRFLGLVEEKGINVKKLACQLLNLSESKPTILHQNLVKLFKTPDKLRLVTTNFDPLFNNYASKLWKLDNPKYYYAPALPLGNDFSGIVYLHGSVLEDEKHIVIMDKDFGRAYLTEGWAKNFLQAMFSEYTVLFIGYSYGDPVIPYLTRGLPPRLNHSNFTFINDEDNADRWKYLGIQPIIYPKNYSSEDPHEALGICLQSWVEHIEMGALEHEHRIKEIVSSPSPPLEPKDLSYIKNVLKDITKVSHFIEHCNKTLDWLHWVDKQGFFNEIFQLNLPVSDISASMSWWLAEYVIIFPEETLRFVQGKGTLINFNLWLSILKKIWINDNVIIQSNIFLRWIIFLLQDCQVQYESDYIDHLLKKCKYPDDRLAALFLFEYLTKLQLKQNNDISLVGKEYFLKEAWQTLFKPNLPGFVISIEPIITSNLQRAQWLLNSVNKSNENYCSLSYSRSAIEPHEQDQFSKDIDILIDAARDILEYLLANNSKYAQKLIEAWSNSEVIILRRLAIHGVTENNQLTPDDKMTWILENNLINNFNFQHEIYRLLYISYPLASTSVRLKLLEQIENSYNSQSTQIEEEKIGYKYEYFNILSWLFSSSEKCNLVAKKLAKIKTVYPHWEVRKYPDLSHWISTGYLSPAFDPSLTVEELLERNPKDNIDWLLTYDKQSGFQSRRGDLLTNIQKAVTQDFNWSFQLVQSLQEKQNWGSDIWREILLGWQRSKFTEEQWELVLTFLIESHQLYLLYLDQITDLLDRSRQEQSEIPFSCFPLAKQLANNLWLTCKNYDRRKPDDFDWIQQAINHPGGKITLFWLHILSREQSNSDQINSTALDEYKEKFGQVLEDNYHEAELGRVMLCTYLSFLFSLDSEWTQENIIPLFDWSTNQKQAQQAWYGFLWRGRWYEQILPILIPLYKKTFHYVLTDLNRHQVSEVFLNHIVSIVIYAPQSFFNQEPQGKLSFIFDFIKQVDSKIREQFAWTIYSVIGNMQEDSIKKLWNEWLKTYWQERNIGRPPALESGELEEMINWLIYLKPVFNEAVDILCESPISVDNGLINSFGVHQLGEVRYYAMLYPEALTKLLLHLLKNTSPNQIFHFNYLEKIFRQLVDTKVSRGELRKICDELSRLTCPNALELSQLLNNEE